MCLITKGITILKGIRLLLPKYIVLIGISLISNFVKEQWNNRSSSKKNSLLILFKLIFFNKEVLIAINPLTASVIL